MNEGMYTILDTLSEFPSRKIAVFARDWLETGPRQLGTALLGCFAGTHRNYGIFLA